MKTSVKENHAIEYKYLKIPAIPKYKNYKAVVYILCIWADGTVLWNHHFAEWYLNKNDGGLQEDSVEYFWKQVDREIIKQIDSSISQGNSVAKYAMHLGSVTEFDICYFSNEKMDVMRIGLFPTEDNKQFFGMRMEVFDRANLIVEKAFRVIPDSDFHRIGEDQIQTLIKRVYLFAGSSP